MIQMRGELFSQHSSNKLSSVLADSWSSCAKICNVLDGTEDFRGFKNIKKKNKSFKSNILSLLCKQKYADRYRMNYCHINIQDLKMEHRGKLLLIVDCLNPQMFIVSRWQHYPTAHPLNFLSSASRKCTLVFWLHELHQRNVNLSRRGSRLIQEFGLWSFTQIQPLNCKHLKALKSQTQANESVTLEAYC